MTATEALHELGQSLWLDHLTRRLLSSGDLRRYIGDFDVTGLTSNPTIFAKAFKKGEYNADIERCRRAGKTDQEIFDELAVDDLRQAALTFRPVYDRTDGVDGWVSLEVSPLLAHSASETVTAAKSLSMLAGQPNLFIKIPGTKEGLVAIEEAIFAGVPINVTLLFSREQYIAAAEAYLRGIERRVAAGLSPRVDSVASVFVSRWDVAVAGKVPGELRNQLGIAIAKRAYVSYRALLDSARWRRLANFGARPQRLLWASTGTKDPNAPDLLYVAALAAPLTINTMPEATLKALADHGAPPVPMPEDGGDCEAVLARFAEVDIEVTALAARLQDDGAKAFVRSWNEMMAEISAKKRASPASGAERTSQP